MIINPFLEELKKLRESSKYAVAEGTYSNLNGFKKYLHIERDVEKKLKSIITKASESNKSQLLLVCGNVGDGKSHILSYLHDELKNVLSEFVIHNDATESHNPNESSNETLYKLLQGFKDVNVNNSTDKIILAINLGTLSKFIEEYGVEFKILKEYIASSKILDSDLIHNEEFDIASNFHHVNFTDYHIYSLTENGPTSEVISTLLEKIVSDNESNLIYKAYLDFKELNLTEDCPILYNYEFLIDKTNRDAIVNLIVQAIVKFKEIVSVRSLLNFFFDLIVPVGLIVDDLELYRIQLKKINESDYLSLLIPNYLFEHPELSSLFSKIGRLDPCIYRYAGLDSNLIQLITSDNPILVFEEFIGDNLVVGIKPKLQSEKLKKEDLTKLFIRLNFFANRNVILKESDPYFNQYITSLYQFNNNKNQSIRQIYILVQEAARKWYGDPKKINKVVFNMGRNQSKYRVFKDFSAIPSFERKEEKTDEILSQFVQEFTLHFKLKDVDQPIRIHIDYGLYEILNRILCGYRPNKKDNNNYISFVSLINKLINQDNSTAALEIDKVNLGRAADYELIKDSFGEYKFRVL